MIAAVLNPRKLCKNAYGNRAAQNKATAPKSSPINSIFRANMPSFGNKLVFLYAFCGITLRAASWGKLRNWCKTDAQTYI